MPFERADVPEGHEFDPYGTLVMLALYFLVLLGAWMYMYFIEFVGNDPTVIGGVLT